MNMLTRSAALAALIVAVATTGASAQHNNPNHAGGAAGSFVAVPTYPPDVNDPALSPGRLLKGVTAPSSAENPTVAGATGLTIVRGDKSTISNARQSTVEEKTGSFASGDAPGG